MAREIDIAADERSSTNTLNMVYLIQSLKYLSEKEPVTLKELSKRCDFCSVHTIRNLLNALYIKTNPKNKMLDFRLLKFIKDKQTEKLVEWQDYMQNNGETFYYKIEFDTKKSEIKLLTDALSMFPFLSSEQTIKLVKSVEQICSVPDVSKLREVMSEYDYKASPDKSIRQLYYSNDFFKTIETITEAIKSRRCIKFDYYMYSSSPNKERLIFGKRSEKVFHPAFFMWSNGFYYLVGKDDGMLDIGYFNLRVDRIKNVETMQNLEICEMEYINPAQYRDENPVMHGGEVEVVEFRVAEKLLNAVVDSFGKNLRLTSIDYTDSSNEEYVVVATKSSIDGAAMWLLEYCNYATALKPPALVDKVKRALIKGLENYN